MRQGLAWVGGGLALAMVISWVAFGMPVAPHGGTAHDAAPNILLERFFRKASWGPLPFFALLTATTTLSAALGLAIARRARPQDAPFDLALALCLTAAFLGVVFLLPLTPLVATVEQSAVLTFALDALALSALVWSAHLYLKFWLGYPRLLSKAEVIDFNWETAAKELRKLPAWRKRLYLRGRDEAVWIEEKRQEWLRMGSRTFDFITSRRGLHIQLAVTLVIAMLWRPGWHGWLKDPVMLGVFSMAPLYVLLAMVATQVAGIVRLHRESGVDADVRKVEWIRASYAVVFVMMIAPLTLMPFWMAFGFLGGEPAILWMIRNQVLEHSTSFVMLAFMASPFIYLLALGASIFARGTIDPRLAVKGFTLWTLLGLTLTFCFVLIERAVALKVVEVFKLPPESGAVVAGAIIAATFIPIRRVAERWVMSWVERFMPATLLASGERKEVAVVLIDITGYSALSARDEHSAVIATTLLQKECRRIADQRGGRVIKSTGDGALLAFDKAENAALALREIHAAFATGSATLSLPDLSLHSGAHWGEVVELHDGDIYGQTVNTTARIADFAKAGEIMLSGALAARLSPDPAVLTPVGPQHFKNLPEPVECLRLN